MNAIGNQLPPGSVQTYMRKHAKTLKSVKIVENLRWLPHKKQRKIEHVHLVLNKNNALNRADRTIQIPENEHILEPICLVEAVRAVFKKLRNLWKSVKIAENHRCIQYPTKIIEKSCFEHVSVVLSTMMWFPRPDRFWSRTANTLPQTSKFYGFWSENCSDP